MQLLLDNYVAVLLAIVIGFILVLTALIASRVLAPSRCLAGDRVD